MTKRTNTQKTIAIDFDGVLHRYSKGWQDGFCYDAPVDGAVEAVGKLVKAGYSYYVFTTRAVEGRDDVDAFEQKRAIYTWLTYWHFPLPLDVTGEKRPAVAYIDDRGIRFTNWNDVRKYWT